MHVVRNKTHTHQSSYYYGKSDWQTMAEMFETMDLTVFTFACFSTNRIDGGENPDVVIGEHKLRQH